MSAASDYTEANIMAAIFDGVAFPIPAHTYLALHTADSSETGAAEVSTATWPSYVRMQAEAGGAMGTGWTATANGVRKNAKQMPFPAYNGTPDLVITHWSVWNALTGGNMLAAGALVTSRTLKTGDVFEFDINSLTIQQS